MTDTATPAVSDAAQFLASHHRIAVMSHVNPDADAIGSVVGLSRALGALGKDVVAAFSDRIPDYARFLAGSEEIRSSLPPGPFDAFVFADSADIDRVGSLYLVDRDRFREAPILNVDHHRTNPLFGTVNLVDGAASSTSELVYRLLQEMGAPIDAETATALLFGVVGDTGSFRNGATTPGSLQTAAELVRLGGEIQRIAYALFEAKRFAAARLWGLVVSSIQLDGGRRIVYGFVTQEMLHREGATSDETEGIVEYLRGIEEARIAALLKENEGGDVRVSLRSGADVDVSLIAKALGGGGHQQAAGCTLPGPLPAARAAIDAAYDTLHLG